MNRIEIQLVIDYFQKMYIHSVFWPSESGKHTEHNPTVNVHYQLSNYFFAESFKGIV